MAVKLPRTVEQRLKRITGSDFEKLCCDLVEELGFTNIRRQASGTQFGFDLAADRKKKRKNEYWFFECKKYSSRVPLKEISNKLLWAETQKDIHCFVIVSNAELSNDLHKLLASYRRRYYVLTWSGQVFQRLLVSCPQTYSKWFPNCLREGGVSPKRFLSEECARFQDEPTLSDLVSPDEEKFKVKIKIGKDSPGDSSFSVVLLDFRNRKIAKLKVRRGKEVELILMADLKGERIRVWYDFYPTACMAGPQIGIEEIQIDEDYLHLPSPAFLQEFNRQWDIVNQKIKAKEPLGNISGTVFVPMQSGDA
jgi:Restriction endonuclease.